MASLTSFTLYWYDYVIFMVTLVPSAFIGIYLGCFGTRQSTIKDYLLGGKNMRMIPIAVSVAVSHFSGTSFLAVPAEVYRYGGGIWLCVLAFTLAGVIGICVFLPVFFKLPLTSIYEYLEKRFDRRTRTLAFILYICSEILLFPFHVYTPSLAIATATGFNVTLTGFVLCAICILYTSLGGLKSVVWTDLLQSIIILAALITIYVVGVQNSGGFLSVWSTAIQGQRLDLFHFGFDLTERDNFWGYTIGITTATVANVIVHQTGLQKLLALPSFKECVRSMICLVICLCVFNSFCVLIGLLCYAKYKDCDPLSSGMMKKHDQLVPLYVTDVAAWIPGISGLLIAGICSASLSSMSSDLNALTAVIYKDFVCFFLKTEPSEKSSSKILKVITVVIGFICMGLVFVVDKLGEVFALSLTLNSLAKGPLLGLFTLGVLFPRANGNGAFYGIISAFVFLLCLIVPSKYYQMQGLIKNPTKPLSTAGCEFLNHTSHLIRNTTEELKTNQWQPPGIFRTSFYFYPFFGMAMTVIFGLIISYLTKGPSEVDDNLLSPLSLSCRSKVKERGTYAEVTQSLEKLERHGNYHE